MASSCQATRRMLVRPGMELSYAEWGVPRSESSHTVLYQHGWPGSRIGGSMLHEQARALGVSVIAVDRPGFGASPFTPAHNHRHWADSLQRLADHLRLERPFSILGASGGGPFAAAAARFMPSERIQALGLVCPFAGPVESTRGMCLANKLLLRAAVHWPGLARALWRLSGRVMAWDPDCIRRFTLHPADRHAIVQFPHLVRMTRDAVLEGLRGGGFGVVHEMALQWQPSTFRLEDIEVPRAFVWHGTDDPVVPLSMAQAYERIPNCQATYYAGETHTSIVFRRLGQALQQLTHPDDAGSSGGGTAATSTASSSGSSSDSGSSEGSGGGDFAQNV